MATHSVKMGIRSAGKWSLQVLLFKHLYRKNYRKNYALLFVEIYTVDV